MATEIPLYQRTELPPARAGIAKPSYELAEGAGLAQFGQGLAKFSGAIWDKLIEAQAANEEAEARGQVNTFIESFKTFAADRPNASPEELQKEWDKISTQIKAIPETLKTGIAKQNFTNFLALNEGLINQKAQTSIEAIKSKQELERSKAIEQSFINDFDISGLVKHVETQVKSGLYDREIAEARLKLQIDGINIAQAKAERETAKDTYRITALAMGKDGIEWVVNPKNTPGVSQEDRFEIQSEVYSALNRLETQAELEVERNDSIIGEQFLSLLINKLEPKKPQLDFDMIKGSNLSFDAKEKWVAKLRTFDNYSEQELKEAFTDKGEVLADIYDKIDNGTLTDELDTMVGKGLSPVTAERIKREIRVPYEKDSEQFFKRIFGWSPELGFENELSAFLYEKTLREWQAEIKKQDATGEKIIEIGRSIARPYFLEHLKAVMPSDTNISRMMELALGEEIEEIKPTEPVKVKEEVGEKAEKEIKEIAEPKTQAEYDALPSGTIYIDTDGTRRRKK